MKKVALMGLLFAAAAYSWPQGAESKWTDGAKRALADGGNAELLVQLSARPELESAVGLPRPQRLQFVYERLRDTALRSQAGIRALLEERGVRYRPFLVANMIHVRDASPELAAELVKRPEVKRIYGNPAFQSRPLPSITRSPPEDGKGGAGAAQDNVVRVGAERVWNEFTKGRGIVVAGQDSGVEWNHPALVRQYRGGPNGHDYHWHDAIREPLQGGKNPCGYALAEPCDDGGHGTHTLGTAVGSDFDRNWIGVAPDAQWIACRNMDSGFGTPAAYLDCFEWLLAPYPAGGDAFRDGSPEMAPHVVNNSWGCPKEEGCEGDEMVDVLENLWHAGIFVVASAGNNGPGCATIGDQPASLSNLMLSVGALGGGDSAAGFSSRGPSALTGATGPDVMAPGTGIRSAIPGGQYQGGWSGTSMAGPHVAGIVALLWSAAPKLIGDIRATFEILRETARPIRAATACGGVPGSAVPNNTFGYGAIDAYAAVQSAVNGSK